MIRSTTFQPAAWILAGLAPVVIVWLQLISSSNSVVPAPFGSMRLLLARSLLAVPLSLFVARGMRNAIRGLSRQSLTVIAVLISIAWWRIGDQIIDQIPINFGSYLAARLVVVVLVQSIWILAVFAHGQPNDSSEQIPAQTWALLLTLAVLPASSYAQQIMSQSLAATKQHLESNRLALAHQHASSLAAMGCSTPIGEIIPRNLAAELARDVAKCHQQLALSLPESPSPRESIHYATLYVAVAKQPDQLAAAIKLLLPHSTAHPEATLLLSAILETQQSSRVVDVLEDFQPQLANLPNTEGRKYRRLMAVRHARCLRAIARADDAEQLLRHSLEVAPQDTAFYLLELGRHFHRLGHFRKARSFYNQAGDKDARYEPIARQAIARLSHDMHLCFLGNQGE